MNVRLLLLVLALAGCDAAEPNRIVGQLASDRVELAAEFAEPVTARHVAEGDLVSAGTLLLSQDTTRIDARIAEADAAVAEARARLAELTRGPRREQIEAARANVDGARRERAFRERELERIREILERGLGAPDSVDRAQAALDAADAALDIAVARLDELLTGTTVEELGQAEARLEQAQARAAQLAVDRGRLALRAPADGVLDSWLVEPGERPQPGTPLAVLLTGAQPYARVYVPEGIRVRVAPGTRAEVRVDGLAEPLAGRVRWVSADAAFTPYFALTEHDRGRLSFAAKIDLETDGERLPDGVPVEAVLVTD
mgnify:FL=1